MSGTFLSYPPLRRPAQYNCQMTNDDDDDDNNDDNDYD